MNSRREGAGGPAGGGFPRPLEGIVPPLLTPLSDRDQLDLAGLERLIEHVVGGGVHGLFVLGTTGEGPSLSYRIRRQLIDRVCEQVNGRVPVLVGITDTAFVESVAIAHHAAESGAAAVVVAPPYYLPEGPPELREYLEHLLPELPVPLFLYNMPPLTKVPIDLDAIDWALDQPGIAGIKDSSGEMGYALRVLKLAERRPEWTLAVGPEELLGEALLMGLHAGVPGGANLFPSLYVQLARAARAGALAETRNLQRQVLDVVQGLYTVGRHPSSVIKGIKCAASCMGLCDDFMAEPFHRFRPPERHRIEQALQKLRTGMAAEGLAV